AVELSKLLRALLAGSGEQPGEVVDAIERSSFGTPDAVAARASISDEQASEVVALSHAIRARRTALPDVATVRAEWEAADEAGQREWAIRYADDLLAALAVVGQGVTDWQREAMHLKRQLASPPPGWFVL